MKKSAVLIVAILFASLHTNAQNFKAEQKKQEKIIKSAHKSKKVTDLEYGKLMKEQKTIKYTIEKYEMDGVLDAHEKNVIHDKLERAERRLRRYKTNGEVY